VADNAVLVTGGAGYIGSHACKALARAGYLPVAYDSLVYGHESAVRWGPFRAWRSRGYRAAVGGDAGAIGLPPL